MVAKTLRNGYTVDGIVADREQDHFQLIVILSFAILGISAIYCLISWILSVLWRNKLKSFHKACLILSALSVSVFAFDVALFLYNSTGIDALLLMAALLGAGLLVFLFFNYVLSLAFSRLRLRWPSLIQKLLAALIPILLLTAWCFYDEVTLRKNLIKERASLGSSYHPYWAPQPTVPVAQPSEQSSPTDQPPASPPPRLIVPPEAQQ